MFKCQKNKFWLEKPINLFCTMDVIPLDDMNIAEQMNSLSRLVLIVFFILTLINFKYNILFLLLSLLFIIILYYIQRKQMTRNNSEHYTKVSGAPTPRSVGPTPRSVGPTPHTLHKYPKPASVGQPLSVTPSSGRFCNDAFELDGPKGAFNNVAYMSNNQRLVGPPNPKTLVAPVIVPPAADMNYWRANNLVVQSGINEESQIDVYQSGYQISTCCPSQNADCLQQLPLYKNRRDLPQSASTSLPHYIENFDQVPRPNESGWVNTSCGYNPEQLYSAGLPTNLAAGNCAKDPSMKQYNKNLFTQTIQPGVYTQSQIIEPINSNIGISFQQQFLPTTREIDQNTGQIMFTQHDPRIFQPEFAPESMIESANEANVYDPRFSGYGTSYRSYTDELTGQTRFYYNDVDAIRMPNYIVRSKIDNQPFADQYGPIPGGDEFGNKFNSDIRGLANNAFLDNALQFRTEMQERLMRKVNTNSWQQRQAPINTGGQRMLGGGSSCR